MTKEPTSAKGPSHEDLVRHLMRSMEEEGFEIEAANVAGRPKPKPLKRGLRPERSRPDVVAKDGRRTVFGVGLLHSDISDTHMPEKLATLAQKCRMLVVCVPEEAAQEALDTLFNQRQMPHRPKMRLLRQPLAKWEDPPKTIGPRTHPGPDFASVVVHKN